MKPQGNSLSKLREFLTTTAQGRSYFIASLTLLLVMLVFFGGIAPSLDASARQYANNDLKQAAIEALTDKLAILAKLTDEEKTKQSLVNALNKVLPDKDKILEEDVVIATSTIAQKQGAVLRSIDFTPLEKNRKVSDVFKTSPKVQAKYANISMEGSRTALANVVRDLEANKRIFNIRGFTMSRKTGRNVIDNGPDAFQITIQAEVFFWDKSIINIVQ